MAKFIEVTYCGGKVMLNTEIIEEVIEEQGRTVIYLAFNCPNAIDQDYISVEESYQQIREMLMGGAKMDGGNEDD
jgi:hypothetical protein